MDSQLKNTLANKVTSSSPDQAQGQSLQHEMTGVLVFALSSSDNFGIPVECVEEILPVSPLHFIPAVPEYILGVMIWHLEIIAVVDIEKLLHLVVQPLDNRKARFLIVRSEEIVFALKVPTVVDVMNVPTSKIQALSEAMDGQPGFEFFEGYLKIEKENITLLNLKELIKQAIEIDGANVSARKN